MEGSFHGRVGFRQYVPNKPNPVSIKMFVMACPSGKVINVHVYQGASTYQADNTGLGLGGQAVLQLTAILDQTHMLYFNRELITHDPGRTTDTDTTNKTTTTEIVGVTVEKTPKKTVVPLPSSNLRYLNADHMPEIPDIDSNSFARCRMEGCSASAIINFSGHSEPIPYDGSLTPER
ncbi:hypothetical protein Btru_052725 [Bulinus truncatus]|nr:hypothetical protein Btru_052725 [Bulinus truncatus]